MQPSRHLGWTGQVEFLLCRIIRESFGLLLTFATLGRGCGAVGRVVASDNRDPWFKSQLQQLSILNVLICQLQLRKDKNKDKEAGIGHICHIEIR